MSLLTLADNCCVFVEKQFQEISLKDKRKEKGGPNRLLFAAKDTGGLILTIVACC